MAIHTEEFSDVTLASDDHDNHGDHEDQDSDKKLKSSVDAISAQRVPEFLQSFQPFNKCYKKP